MKLTGRHPGKGAHRGLFWGNYLLIQLPPYTHPRSRSLSVLPSSHANLASAPPPECPINILGLIELMSTPRGPAPGSLSWSSSPMDYPGDQRANCSPGVTAAPGSLERGSSFAVSQAHHLRRPITHGALGPEPA